MKHHTTQITSRRRVLRQFVLAAGTVAVLPLVGVPISTRAAAAETSGKASKAAVKYQDHPDGTSFCANCANFIPGATPDAPGTCLVVAGEILPKGWCLAYAAG